MCPDPTYMHVTSRSTEIIAYCRMAYHRHYKTEPVGHIADRQQIYTA